MKIQMTLCKNCDRIQEDHICGGCYCTNHLTSIQLYSREDVKEAFLYGISDSACEDHYDKWNREWEYWIEEKDKKDEKTKGEFKLNE